MSAIGYNLSNLTTFRGRQGPKSFWIYALFLAVLGFGAQLLLWAAAEPAMAGAVGQGAEIVPFVGESDSYNLEEFALSAAAFQKDLTRFAWATFAVQTAIVLLGLSAFARRLHDSGLSGWISVLPIALYLGGRGYMSYLAPAIGDGDLDVSAAGADNGAVQAVQLQELAVQHFEVAYLTGWIGVLVAVMLAMLPSDAQPNSYGPPPGRAA